VQFVQQRLPAAPANGGGKRGANGSIGNGSGAMVAVRRQERRWFIVGCCDRRSAECGRRCGFRTTCHWR
jgi:hypothetical protein